MTMTISIPPLPDDFLQRARSAATDDQGQPVKRLRAAGGEPCRDVLRRARAGEELILASFSPFTLAGPYKEYGPIFLLADESDETVQRDTMPFDESNQYLREQFVIRAYSATEEIVDAKLTTPTAAMDVVREFFDSPDVAFLHARFPAYGCFACRIDRVK
jgi:uncharacterized protein DUF1203